jgi:hypothetical protein
MHNSSQFTLASARNIALGLQLRKHQLNHPQGLDFPASFKNATKDEKVGIASRFQSNQEAGPKDDREESGRQMQLHWAN